ncbi:hypothetical protein [Cloacibacterium normanense]|uniref:hypothetical protein n=1 Tax=Cloacibacterium normanense TaxID=237258 RepID=UPI00391B5E81
MNTAHLPLDDLKKYGIIDQELSFSKKLNEKDIEKFLKGFIMIAENDKHRITFQLQDNNTKLDVHLFERDESLLTLLEQSKKEVQYSTERELDDDRNELDYHRKVMVFNDQENKVEEFDLLKNALRLTNIILSRKSQKESNRYRIELLNLKSFLQEQMNKFPEKSKEITRNINIVSGEIQTVNSISHKDSEPTKNENIFNNKDNGLLEESVELKGNKQPEIEKEEKQRGFKR